MKDIICKGRYGTIRVGYHKIKKRFVAIKIINKKAMSKEDMENIRKRKSKFIKNKKRWRIKKIIF